MWLSSFPNTICWRDCLFSIGYFFLLFQRLVDHIVVGPFLIDLCVCFCASTMLSWWSQLCNIAWSQALWCPQLWFSFSTFFWLFRVFSCSIQILRLFVQLCEKSWWYFHRDFIECVDCPGKHRYFNNICSSNPCTWNIFPFLCVFLNFFHECSIVFWVQFLCPFG